MMSEYGMVGTISYATARYFDWTSSVPMIQEKPIDVKASLDTLSTGKSIPRYSVVKTILHSAPLFFLKYLDNLNKMLLHICATVAPFSDQAGHLCVFFIGFCVIIHCRRSEE
jgi:hypothetical protein